MGTRSAFFSVRKGCRDLESYKSIREASTDLGVSWRAVRDAIRSGKVRATRFGNSNWKLEKDSVRGLVKKY